MAVLDVGSMGIEDVGDILHQTSLADLAALNRHEVLENRSVTQLRRMDVQAVTGFLQPLERVKRQPNGGVAGRAEIVLGARFGFLGGIGVGSTIVGAGLVDVVLDLDSVKGQR